uniref:Mabr_orf8 n=1 Tax=Mamestra brassicae nuclear polyhedrosis virus TaxID=78219 RepID=J7H7F6_NPVMB|nr:Mabr_orf8 [Mamestra brassicae multiple nucleopolyhedrovirus]AIL25085.1 Orf7a [Mamestra brassicae multiple nucleopolyhedrovirus]WNA17387.1 hypothetical protein [Alphabaculovirus mabrassicae]
MSLINQPNDMSLQVMTSLSYQVINVILYVAFVTYFFALQKKSPLFRHQYTVEYFES